jgi:hypothetical protein
MLKMPDTKAKFFSVTHSTKIQGVHYIPSVCYPLTAGLQAVVEEMAAKDMAKVYPERVRFVTGVPYPVKKPDTGIAAPQPPVLSAPEVQAGAVVKPDGATPFAASEKPGRKSGRGAFTTQTNREFD